MKSPSKKIVFGLANQAVMIGGVYVALLILDDMYSSVFMLLFVTQISIQAIVYILDAGLTNYVIREFSDNKESSLAGSYSSIDMYYKAMSFISFILTLIYFLGVGEVWDDYLMEVVLFSATISIRFLCLLNRAIYLSKERHFVVYTISILGNVGRFFVVPVASITYSIDGVYFVLLFFLVSCLEYIAYVFFQRHLIHLNVMYPNNSKVLYSNIISILLKSRIYLVLGIASALVFQLDRLLLPLYFDSELALIYSYAYYLGFGLIYISGAINTAYLPTLCRVRGDLSLFKKYFKSYFFSFIGLIIIYTSFMFTFGHSILEFWIGTSRLDILDGYVINILIFVTLLSLAGIMYSIAFVEKSLSRYCVPVIGLLLAMAILFFLAVHKSSFYFYIKYSPMLALSYIFSLLIIYRRQLLCYLAVK